MPLNNSKSKWEKKDKQRYNMSGFFLQIEKPVVHNVF